MTQEKQEECAIDAYGLVKKFGDEITAVNGVDLNILPNTIYALLGPNGAGKTTTINMLTTLLQPTGGTACVAGYDIVSQANKVRENIGVTFQETVLDDRLTGRQVLEYHGRLYGMDKTQRHQKIDELLTLVELEEAASRRIDTYSGGMKRRLEMIRGLMTEPKVLFLDEPTLGLDPQSRSRIGEYILGLTKNLGMTVMLTTHYMDEAQTLADMVGIIDHGVIMVEGTPADLIEQMGADVVNIHGTGDQAAFVGKLEEIEFVQSVITGDELIQAGVESGSRRLVELVSVASQSGFRIEDISVAKPALGDVFLKYTGRQFRD